MTLQIWRSDFGLASIEPESLRFLTCTRICAAPVTVVPMSSPFTSPSGELPVFRDGCSVAHTQFQEFIDHLKKQGQSMPVDDHLSEVEQAELTAYSSLVMNNIAPAMNYLLWMDELNFNTFTRSWFSHTIGFPYNQFYVWKRRQHIIQALHNRFTGDLISDKHIETATHKLASEAIQILATKLGDKKYLFGDKPTSLDAIVFGYLAPLIKIPMPKDALQIQLKTFSGLVRYVDSIASIYMPLSEEDIRAQRKSIDYYEKRKEEAQIEVGVEKEQETQLEETDFPLRNKIMFAVAAVALSLGLAYHIGLITVEVVEKERRTEMREREE